jgi:hypothetical protein
MNDKVTISWGEILAQRQQKKWSTVTVHNTHPVQTHLVPDKDGMQQTLHAGEKREFPMLDEDIAWFREQRRPGRIKYNDRGELFTCPLHPVVIEDIAPLPPANAAAAEEARQPIK